ncbi:peptidase dimerization domain-containing protein [Nonomuraea aridisoli]|uniref:peptidase dimerization domain-containing protein n=1 Tax=Nonomuraea aridisoli TaxID=2070368 RepID=UPI001F45A8BB|nr:peptidase dimerization domain-containing protein [Nonomuraea aridisoli]
MTEAGLAAPIVVGHSLGGVLVTMYAATYAARGHRPAMPVSKSGGQPDRARPAPGLGEIWDSLRVNIQVYEITVGRSLSSVTAVLRGGHPGAAVLGGEPAPAVLLRADMDALPITETTRLDHVGQVDGAMHACGAGLFLSRPGPLMAATAGLKVTVYGTGGHASMPHLSRDPVTVAAEIVTSLQTPVTRRFDVFDPVVVTVGSIHAGTGSTVIPDTAEIDATVRTFSAANQARLRTETTAAISTSSRAAPTIRRRRRSTTARERCSTTGCSPTAH